MLYLCYVALSLLFLMAQQWVLIILHSVEAKNIAFQIKIEKDDFNELVFGFFVALILLVFSFDILELLSLYYIEAFNEENFLVDIYVLIAGGVKAVLEHILDQLIILKRLEHIGKDLVKTHEVSCINIEQDSNKVFKVLRLYYTCEIIYKKL